MVAAGLNGQHAVFYLLCNHTVFSAGKEYGINFPSQYASPAKVQARPGSKGALLAIKSSREKMAERITSKIEASQDQSEYKDDYPTRDASSLDNAISSNKSTDSNPPRSAVLQACVLTSSALLVLGAVVRQASHVAFAEGWIMFDSAEISFHFQVWHLELIAALVILISSSRYVLLHTWQEFSKSSEAANQQVLSSLELTDYIIVACLPGVSEEFLFRGGLLPLFGLNWMSALAVAVIFGCLHLNGGRKYSFAIWATFVGFSYGMAAIISSSIIVPMVAHSLNNLIGGIMWRYNSTFKEKS